jgi:hypothetical protein
MEDGEIKERLALVVVGRRFPQVQAPYTISTDWQCRAQMAQLSHFDSHRFFAAPLINERG